MLEHCKESNLTLKRHPKTQIHFVWVRFEVGARSVVPGLNYYRRKNLGLVVDRIKKAKNVLGVLGRLGVFTNGVHPAR